MSSIQQVINNYKNICDQIKRCNVDLAQLRERKQVIEVDIEEMLKGVDGPGIVVEGVQVFMERKQRRERLGQKKKQEQVVRILEAHHVRDPEKVYAELSNVGDVREKNVVKIKTK